MSKKSRQRIVENCLVIWVNQNIDSRNSDYQSTIETLRSIVNQVEECKTAEECIEQLKRNETETSFVIYSDTVAQHLVPHIHDMPKLGAIFILSNNKQDLLEWTKDWMKIKGIYISIKLICNALKMEVNQCDQNNTVLGFMASNLEDSERTS
ncbi:hypothetical protein I4U23_027354 [Adineta vaga]|nr:hypothetical protein I4U23_027354 [Adineta vaga]